MAARYGHRPSGRPPVMRHGRRRNATRCRQVQSSAATICHHDARHGDRRVRASPDKARSWAPPRRCPRPRTTRRDEAVIPTCQRPPVAPVQETSTGACRARKTSNSGARGRSECRAGATARSRAAADCASQPCRMAGVSEHPRPVVVHGVQPLRSRCLHVLLLALRPASPWMTGARRVFCHSP